MLSGVMASAIVIGNGRPLDPERSGEDPVEFGIREVIERRPRVGLAKHHRPVHGTGGDRHRPADAGLERLLQVERVERERDVAARRGLPREIIITAESETPVVEAMSWPRCCRACSVPVETVTSMLPFLVCRPATPSTVETGSALEPRKLTFPVVVAIASEPTLFAAVANATSPPAFTASEFSASGPTAVSVTEPPDVRCSSVVLDGGDRGGDHDRTGRVVSDLDLPGGDAVDLRAGQSQDPVESAALEVDLLVGRELLQRRRSRSSRPCRSRSCCWR